MITLSTCKFFSYLGIVCVITLALVQTAHSISCFECNSKLDTNCSLSPPPDYLLKNCSNNVENIVYTMCRKIKQTIDFEVNGLQPDRDRIIRSCAYEPHADASKDCYQRAGFGGRQEVCTCSSDKCNESTNLKYNYAILLLSTFAVYGINLLTKS